MPFHSSIPDISIAPLQVYYYSEALPSPDYSIDAVSELTLQSAHGWRLRGDWGTVPLKFEVGHGQCIHLP